MKYRRVLLITELGSDPRRLVAMIRRIAPTADLLIVVARLPARKFAWFSTEAPDDLKEAADASMDALRNAAAGAAHHVDVRLEPDLVANDLAELTAVAQIDLLVAGALSQSGISVIAELRQRRSLAVLWTVGVPFRDRPISEVRCVALGSRARAAVAAFLRDHGDRTLHATVVLPALPPTGSLAATLDLTGIRARVDTATPTSAKREIDLLVLARFPRALLPAVPWPAPVLILPFAPAPAIALRRAIDVADLVDDNGVLRVSIHYASGVGRNDPIPDQQVAFVSNGRIVATIETHDGAGELPAGVTGQAFGVFRVAEKTGDDPLGNIEQQVTLIRPGSKALILFESDLSDDDLSMLTSVAQKESGELLAVRMRPMLSCRSIRSRLRKAGLPLQVADASAVLDEGAALDVAREVDPVRLARVASRMRAAGFPVIAIVHGGPHTPRTIGFAALRAEDVAAAHLNFKAPARQPPSLGRRLETTTGAAQLPGNHIEVEMDNAKARRWLLDAIAGATQRVHLQLYMALDDDVGAPVESALAEAGARGVKVRVVVDSLHGFEGSFGAHNQLLDRLGSRPGVELRVSRPVTGIPSLEDLKQRDHRKVTIVDGALALLGGRNLSHEYYTGFEEIRLTPQSKWREVPWLDAGARVKGPAVAALEQSFLDAWTVGGGSPFEISEV
ncbi:MAG: phospholipase D-like domain-containing protein, partial [Thermoanaerobaculia bacterium]